MIFKQLFDYESFTYTYILGDKQTKEAVIIDAVKTQFERDKKLIKELGLDLKYILETHAHADHITSARKLKKTFSMAKIGYSSYAGVTGPDLQLQDKEVLKIGSIGIQVLLTPGHTNGCMSLYTEGQIFTGDALLIRGTGRTDFQSGDAGTLYDSITQKIFTLPDETFIHPAHDYNGYTVSTVKEEKNFNPRLANKSRTEFINIMESLNLPYPQKIKDSLPANMQCGTL